jgi:hypothetical protein
MDKFDNYKSLDWDYSVFVFPFVLENKNNNFWSIKKEREDFLYNLNSICNNYGLSILTYQDFGEKRNHLHIPIQKKISTNFCYINLIQELTPEISLGNDEPIFFNTKEDIYSFIEYFFLYKGFINKRSLLTEKQNH